MTISEHEDLIARHFDAALNADERLRLDQLLINDKSVASLFVKYAQLHERLKSYALDQMSGPTEVIEFSSRQATPRVNHFKRPLYALVACILCAFAAAYWFSTNMVRAEVRVELVRGEVFLNDLLMNTQVAALAGPQHIRTTVNSAAILVLADGSRIHIDADSEIGFENNNTIHLADASIRCDIEKRDLDHRLLLKSSEATIQVIGTAFEIINRNGVTNVAVEHGVVQVQTAHQKNPIELKATDTLRVSKRFLVSSAERAVERGAVATSKTIWGLDFESGQLGNDCERGLIVPDPLIPSGNGSRYCASAVKFGRDDQAGVLQFVLKSKDQTYFVVEEGASISFRYWASEPCGWIGIWMAAPPEHLYLHYHQEFVPVPNKWMRASIRLNDCMRGDSPDATESVPVGSPIYWLNFQSGNLPGAKFFIDDVRIEVPVK